MSLKIRLSRVGAVHKPYYRVVVAETRSRRDGSPVELLGTYQPTVKGKEINLKLDRIDYWVSKGAKPSDTLNSLIKKARKAPAAATS
ncbi:MAG: 30S ribosomal protein S16 [Verrucomicrobiota bacterium]|nr:30S ribosomal protein S16 [Verrucomicrobiota bacterium]